MKQQALLFCHGYQPPFVDVCNQYAEALHTAGYSVNVVYLVGVPDAQIKCVTIADHVYFLAQTKSAVRGLKLVVIRRLLALCREKKFAVIVCHRYKPAYIMALVARCMRLPKIIAVMHELGTLKRGSRRLFVRWLARKQLSLTGVSDAVRQDILASAHFLAADEVRVLPNVINVAQFSAQLLTPAAARQTLQLSADDFVIGNIGRLVKNKDQATLIEAFALVIKQYPRTKLVIMGSGVLAESLQELAVHRGVADSVIFTGFVAQAFRFIPAFDVFVSASTQEAFGRVLLEAMVAQVPIVATRVHGVPEVVDTAGLLVPPNSPSSLAQALQTLLSLSVAQLRQQGMAGYTRVQQHFSSQAFAQLFLTELHRYQ